MGGGLKSYKHHKCPGGDRKVQITFLKAVNHHQILEEILKLLTDLPPLLLAPHRTSQNLCCYLSPSKHWETLFVLKFFLSVAVPTINILFVFLYDVIGSSAFHNYDGYTVESSGSICYTNVSSTVADKMEPLIKLHLVVIMAFISSSFCGGFSKMISWESGIHQWLFT